MSFLQPSHGIVAALLCAGWGSWSVATRACAASSPSPGSAEITAPNDAAVAIEPRPAEHRAPSSYVIETDPAEAPCRTMPEIRPHLATLPADPPLVVVIRFDERRQNAAASAAVIAAILESHGIEVREVASADASPASRIGFVFVEDRGSAEGLVRLVPNVLGHLVPIRLNASDVADPQPGLVQITIGKDRSTS